MTRADLIQRRTQILLTLGCDGSDVPELLPQTEGIGTRGEPPRGGLPLTDEPHVEAWREYAAEAQNRGVVPVLRERLVQFAFPVEEGMSGKESYRNATRKGLWPSTGAGLELAAPESLELSIHPTPVGRIPILVAGDRRDFVALVQALTARNEPVDVPGSMGASMVTGLNNWDRVARYRDAWEAEREGRPDSETWKQEFRRLASRKERYQDRLIILSRGPYGAVDAPEVGLDLAEWLDRSLAIRREHECFHYFTLRRFGSIKLCILDEVLADFAAIVAVFGTYRHELALRFLGLERFPEIRPGGRFWNYLGKPRLSDRASKVLARLTHAAIVTLGDLAKASPRLLSEQDRRDRLLAGLCGLSLEEMASEQIGDLMVAPIDS